MISCGINADREVAVLALTKAIEQILRADLSVEIHGDSLVITEEIDIASETFNGRCPTILLPNGSKLIYAGQNNISQDYPVRSLDIKPRTRNALESAGIVYLSDLMSCSEWDICKLSAFGEVSLKDLKEALAGIGLKLPKKST